MDGCAAQLFNCHIFMGDGFDNLGAGEKHIGVVFHHD